MNLPKGRLQNVFATRDAEPKIQTLRRRSESAVEKGTLPVENKTAPEQGPIILLTKSAKINNGESGRKKTAKDSSNIKGDIMQKTKTVSKRSSTPRGKKEILPTVSTGQSSDVSLVISPSMSLLDDTANHLHSLMRGLHANQPEPEIRAFDPERVNSACNCAKQIYSIMRLKLDAIKVQGASR